MKKPAAYWDKLDKDWVQCRLCPHQCKIKPGGEGICRNKVNEGGALFAAHYGEFTALAMDPMEKKPLYHFYPGRMIFSIGTQGCNLACGFCQNYHLWDGEVRTDEAMPGKIVGLALREGSTAIAYTYNEPFVSFEFVRDTARLAHESGLKNVLVTNGFYQPEPFAELLPLIDAMNIDLKSINDDFYRKLCRGRLEPVLRTIETATPRTLVELTNLIVTGENDRDEDFEKLTDWVASVNPEMPLHFSAYRPMHKLRNPSTPEERLRTAFRIARRKLHYVYLGNVMLEEGQDSACPRCGALLVHRSGYRTRIVELAGEHCGKCGAKVNFVNEGVC